MLVAVTDSSSIIVTRRTVRVGGFALAADVFTPSAEERPIVLCCLPGGGMSRRYWDLMPPNDESYSFALRMVRCGVTVIALDHVGTGESTFPPGRAPLLGQAIAANDAAFRLLCDELAETGIGGGPIPNPRRIGVGHSMGAVLSVRQQAAYETYDALALLGFSLAGLPAAVPAEILDATGDGPPDDELLAELTLRMFGTPYPTVRIAVDQTRHPGDAARQTLAEAGTLLLGAGGLLSLLPGNVAQDAARLRVPVLLLNGANDTLIGTEPGRFGTAGFDARVLPDAGHNHNIAPTRELFWAELLRWAGALPGVKSTPPVRPPAGRADA
ncbi:MAG TPA: alpha/beta fold hydrolase [Pseudonocardiaceae bacterium]|jgi:alpha-beta hydrolase superfamily lysophospholipase|nr:alpha/beta fold hydrolase [Pseudonocardiaceae bacterium]